MIEFKKYTSEQASARFEELKDSNFVGIINKGSPFFNVRKSMLDELSKLQSLTPYLQDLELGKIFHKVLLEMKGVDLSILTTTSFWRFIALDVMPEVIYDRFSTNGKIDDALKAHFYSKAVRIYPYDLFWYYEIFSKGTEQETYDFLSKKCFSTDTILNTIERMGRKGFRKDIFRSILNKYSTLDFSKFPSTKPNLILRSILIQHTSKNAVFIPDCYEGGVDGYVEMLFNTTLGG